MSVLEETVPASYASIPFLVLRSSIAGGRKDSLKEFPNSNLQTVEDLGLKPRSFRLECVTTTDADGSNYIQNRDALLNVLEKGGKDILIHPLYGRLENIVVRDFTLVEDFQSLGPAQFSVAFAVSDSDGRPKTSGDTLSLVAQSRNNAVTQMNSEFSSRFNISNNFPSNYTSAVDKCDDIALAFDSNSNLLSIATSELNDFNAQLAEFSGSITELVLDPIALSDSVSNLFQTVNALYATAESTYEVIKKFFDFGKDDLEITETTSILTERNRNNNQLNFIMQYQSLILNYVNASEIEYTTIDQIEEKEIDLESQYQDVITLDITSASLDSLNDLRVQTQKFLADQKLNASQVISIKTNTIPSRVLAYQYYGSSERGEDLSTLNKDLNTSFLSGDISIYTS